MTDEHTIESASLAERPELGALLAKIGWICQSIRIAALLYAAWVLYLLTAHWTDTAAINAGYGRLLGKDLSGITPWQQAAALGVELAIWLFMAAACYSAWRLFTAYLAGSIFTAEAAGWLRRTASYGVIAQLLSIASRPLLAIILTLHFPAGEHQRAVLIFFQPNDLLTLLLLFGFLALAHIQKTAAEIHSEFQEIV
jgi:Protein of unknown function (DUF2975)